MSLPPNHSGIPRRTSEDTEGDVQRILGKLEASGQDLTILRLLANAEHLFRPFMLLSSQLLHRGVLAPEIRETVVLWMAARDNTSYEWLEHVPMALKAGVTQDTINRIEAKQSLDDAPEDITLALLIAEDLLAARGIRADRFADAQCRWGIDGALELILVVGYWGGMVPTIIAGLGLKAPDSYDHCSLRRGRFSTSHDRSVSGDRDELVLGIGR